MQERRKAILALWAFLSFFCFSYSASAEINVTLVSPANGNVSLSDNMTFLCNASSNAGVYNISLFTNISGSFASYNTNGVMELENDSNTTLLCHFDNSYTCEDGEVGTNSSTDFADSMFIKGVRINNTNALTYPTSGNIMLSRGAIEFWIKVGFSPSISQVFLFSTNNGDINSIQIDYESGTVNFFIIDDSGEMITADKSVAWSTGEWHHIAAIWDLENGVNPEDNKSYLFVDGSNESVQYGDTGFGSYNPNFEPPSPYFYLGSNAVGELQADMSVFDELRISSWPRSPEEINASYLKGVGDHSTYIAEWNITGILDGTYKWNCLAYDNNSNSNWAASNSTFYVDLYSPPNVTSVSLMPDNDDDRDPGVTINVTANITDSSNVSSTVFQYRNWSESDWTNKTMTNISSVEWTTSFNTSNEKTVYYYRVWANDTLNRANYSANYSVNITYDYTWIINSSEFGTENGMVNDNKELGTLIVNNTGDYTLLFTLTDNWYRDVRYNGSLTHTYSFSLSQKTAGNVTINATFEDHANERNFTINVTAYNPYETSTPPLRTINMSMNSYTSGPYFSIQIVLPPTTVYQSQTFNLTTRIRNLGNETANDTWLNWTLPSGWNNVSGNLSSNIGNLTSGSTTEKIITVTINPNTASPGTYIIYVNASCNQSANNASAVIGVSCSSSDGVCGSGCSYVTDTDCSVPRTGGGTTLTSIAGIPKEYKFDLIIPSRVDINRGESRIFRVGVNNTVSGTVLSNVYLSILGYPQTFMSIKPQYLSGMAYGDVKYFEVEIRAPSYAVYTEYSLNISVSGKFYEENKTITAAKTGNMLLVTQKFISNETTGYLELAQSTLVEMENAGFEAKQITEIVDQIKKSIDDGNYDKAKELYDSVANLKESAFSLNAQITDLEGKINDIKKWNLNLPESERMLSLAKSAFMRGDYARAEERISNAMLAYSVESLNAGIWMYMYNNIWFIIIGLVCATIVIFYGRRRMKRRSLSKSLVSLAREEDKIYELVDKLRKDHFLNKKISDESYQRTFRNYEKELSEIRKRKAESLGKIAEVPGKRYAINKLKEEEKKTRNMIINLQKKYFERNEVGKYHYHLAIKDLKVELAEIERLKEMVEDAAHA